VLQCKVYPVYTDFIRYEHENKRGKVVEQTIYIVGKGRVENVMLQFVCTAKTSKR